MYRNMNRMSTLILVGGLFFQSFIFPAIAQNQNPKGSLYLEIRKTYPAVLVNGATVTQGQIEQQMNRLKRRDFLSSNKVVEDLTPARIRIMARDMMIDEYVALQLAAKSGIQVSTEEVQQAFVGMAIEAGDSQTFEENLQKQGLMNEGLMSEGLKNLYIDKLRKHFAATLPPPSEQDLRDFYEANRIVFQATPERVFAREIFLVVSDEAKKSLEKEMEIKNRAKELIQRLKQGEDFIKLADRYTENPDGIGRGGSLGWVLPGLGSRLLEPHLFKMKPGEILDEPIRVTGGYSIPTIEAHEEAVFVPFEEAKDRVLRGWQIGKFKEWIQEERKNATIEYFEDLPQKDILNGKRPQKTYQP